MTLPPGPRVSGIFGLLMWMAAPDASFRRQFERWGDLVKVTNPLVGDEVVVNHPALIKEIFTGDPDVFHAGAANRLLGPVVGQSVLTLDGPRHKRQRKLLLPPFHGKRLAVYAETMEAITARVIATWPQGEPMSLLPSMQRITLDVILETVFGVRHEDQLDELRTRLMAMMDRAQSPLGMLRMLPALQRDLPFTGWRSMRERIEAADEVIFRIIREARDARDDARDDILAMLLSAVDEDGEPMSDRELRDELVTLLLAGHETTATALCWAFEEILRRPEVLRRLRDEMDSASDPLCHGKLPYLDATIKEVLRLRPIVPMVMRKLQAPIQLGGYDVPAGTFVVPCIYNAQRHPDCWDEPESFRPERFLDATIDPFAWLPFGGGARRCIGMTFALYEMRVVLATILSRLELRPGHHTPKVALRSFTFAPK
ncbi:MAG: cytochrome P450, partial [Polyangiaceae bacterium]